jgi:excisionase family DNA binding protein
VTINAKPESPVLTLAQAARYLQVSKAHLSNVINGKVPGVEHLRFFRMGRRILIKREWIDQWLEVENREVLQR